VTGTRRQLGQLSVRRPRGGRRCLVLYFIQTTARCRSTVRWPALAFSSSVPFSRSALLPRRGAARTGTRRRSRTCGGGTDDPRAWPERPSEAKSKPTGVLLECQPRPRVPRGGSSRSAAG
jgi:hypothetical protein